MSDAARDRIAERVKNAYAAGYEDARADRAGRMDEVADAETGRIIEIFATYYGHFNDGCSCCSTSDLFTSLGFTVDEWEELSGGWEAVDPAFGADDDGGEQ